MPFREKTTCRRTSRLTGVRTALVTTCPCHAPQHTVSDVVLIGGGHLPMPGEVSLAHNGVLFRTGKESSRCALCTLFNSG